MRGKGMRQQSALELLTTYSWALLIIAIFVAAVAVINSARPATNYLASSCTIEPLLPCTQTLLTYNSVSPIKFSILFDNNLGQTMFFPVNALNITVSNIGTKGVSYATGNCTPSLALQGTPILCSAYIPGSIKPPIGTQETLTFTLSYQLCKGSTKASCPSTLYKTTGQSSQTMAPSATSFHTLIVQTNPTSGTVNLNGVTYLNGANVLLLTNKYSAYAIPPTGYRFVAWALTGLSGGSSSLSSTSTQNSILNLSSNATLVASFNSIAPTTTVTLTSTSTTTSTIAAPTAPGAPTGLSATAISSSQINLAWTAPASNGGSAITGYKIERSTDGGSTWSTVVANTGSTSTAYSDTGLSPGTTYTYRVSAINGVGTGSPSGNAAATTSATVPGAPTGLGATAISYSQINLAWSAPASNGGASITGYEIDRSTNGGTSWSVDVANTGSTSTAYSDTGLSGGTTYTYRVEAINSVGAGSSSGTASATTPATVPGAPTGLSATAISSSQINLAWTAPSSNGGASITGYEIDRSTNGGSSWSVDVANTGSTSTAYSDTGLSGSTTYTYRVEAINSAGTGSSSNTASATTQSSVSYPTGNPTFTTYGSWSTSTYNTQVGAANTISNDGSYGYMNTQDSWSAQDEGAYWTWDFGSSMTKTFTVKWYQTATYLSSYCLDFTTTLYASNDGSSWTQITSHDLGSGGTGSGTLSYGSSGSPITSTITGTYRYIKVQEYSTTSCMSAPGNSFVDTVYAQ